MEKDADKQLEARLDDNKYDESQLIEMRVALDVPYQTSQSEFERHYGEIEIDGKYYSYVKRKIENGYLVLKCIPNSSKQMIKAAGNDFFKNANGLDQTNKDQKQGSNNNLAKNFWSEYDGREADFNIAHFSLFIDQQYADKEFGLTNMISKLPGQPPEAICFINMA